MPRARAADDIAMRRRYAMMPARRIRRTLDASCSVTDGENGRNFHCGHSILMPLSCHAGAGAMPLSPLLLLIADMYLLMPYLSMPAAPFCCHLLAFH